ncbi:MAG: putative rane protein [Acidimicrobiaceae bacterium]|nr:putative rane protein [Acidimicrobiaceae bacterium]
MLLHLYLGGMIFTHGFKKVFKGGKLAGTARWFESIGMKPGMLNAYAAASTELGAGVLLIFGLLTPFASAALIALMIVAIVSVHRKNGFMITNPGGGVEYCVTIAVAALTLGSLGAGKYSLDHAWGVFNTWTTSRDFLVTLIVGVVGGVLQLVTFYRPPRPAE